MEQQLLKDTIKSLLELVSSLVKQLETTEETEEQMNVEYTCDDPEFYTDIHKNKSKEELLQLYYDLEQHMRSCDSLSCEDTIKAEMESIRRIIKQL